MRNTTRSVTRVAAVVAGLLALTVTVAVPTYAEETTPRRVAEPQRMLIESVHAAGKVLEIGNDRAQVTGPTAEPAAAAIFALAAAAENVQQQAVLAYPVLGTQSSYVFADADGQVLVRRDNADGSFRYLTLADVPVDEAAANPYARWDVSSAGDGTVYIANGQRDRDGRIAQLDMYNWATADAAEIQTYDAGTAAVQKWRMHPLTPQVAAIAGRVELGTAPTLPTEITASYPWGRRQALTAVAWTMPDATVWEREGTVRVEGHGTGWFGERVDLAAEYVVGVTGDARDSSLTGYPGITLAELRMLAPRTVERTVSGSSDTVTAPVTWDWSTVDADDTAAVGSFTVSATASAGFAAKLVVTIVPATAVNVLRGAGVHHDVTYINGAFALTDGVRDVSGFGDWRSGGAANRVNPNRVSFFFDQPRRVTGVGVFDLGGTHNIGQITVQYRDIRGGWVDLPVEGATWPHQNADADLSLVVDSEPVLATGARVSIGDKSSATWMTLSEIEVYGPDAAVTR